MGIKSKPLRAERLGKITLFDRHGTVEGVKFDLRHELLDPREWETDTIGLDDDWSKRRIQGRPFIWFPWYGEFNKITVLDNLRRKNRDTAAQLTPEEEEGVLKQFTPDTVIHGGDTLSIKDVERIRLSGTTDLDDFSDAEIRAATLQITRREGSVEELEAPLFSFGRNRITNNRTRNNFYRLKNRIFAFIEKVGVEADEEKYAYAMSAARVAALLEFLLGPDEEIFQRQDNSRRWLAAVRTLDLVSHAVAVGYYWAKAESSVSVVPLAEKAMRSRQGGSLGGKMGTVARRNKAAKWILIAADIATVFRRERPDASQERVADEILGRWKSEDIKHPSHSRLKKLIAELEKSGNLPKRRKSVG